MRWNGHNSTSDHSLDSTIRLGEPENLYSDDVCALRRQMWMRIAYFHCACAETGASVHPSTILTAPFDSATPKTCLVVMFSLYDEVLWTKIAYFHCACAETGTSVHPRTHLTAPFDSATTKTCVVMTFSLYNEGCGRKSHIFTAHAQKLAQVYIGAQFWQHRSTQRPRKPNSHEIIALRQRIRWGACSQHYMRREHCVQWLVYFYVTLYNRFWTSLRYGNIILFIYFFVRIIWIFFAQKSLESCLIRIQIT